MNRSKRLQQVVRFSLAAAAFAAAMPALSTDTLPEVVVTAQKRTESIQDVPIAVSAISQSELQSRGIDGGKDILEAIPNVTYSKQNFTSFNLQIRGVGSKLISGTGDQGVGIHENNVPLTVSRFAETEFYDMERIEVLRGPQGTLYGRNATGGVFNAITAKPTDKEDASITLDGGNYASAKLKGMLNIPLGDMFALRIAGSWLSRAGYIYDIPRNTDVDGRALWGTRATLAFRPNDSFTSTLMYEHFDENDDRQRTGAQLCDKDPGPTQVSGFATDATTKGLLSQGCLPASLYSPASFGTVNSAASLGGMFANLIGLQTGDWFAGKQVSTDLRTTDAYILPTYRARNDLVELNNEWKIDNDLTLTSLTSYNRDFLRSTEDYDRAVPSVPFNVVPGLTDGQGNFTDPQLGTSNGALLADISLSQSTQWTEELRLQSAFDSPFNFNVGAIYLDYKAPIDGGYYVLFNTGTAYAEVYGATHSPPGIPIDLNSPPNGLGHNYYYNYQSYELKSLAGFGELYWKMTDALKWTLGFRYTDDKKTAVSYPIELLVPGSLGFPTSQNQQASFKEPTGRFGLDWKVSDRSLLYAMISRGYKGGGFNPPGVVGNSGVQETFKPEFVNAFELGSKNSFFGDTLIFNATGFYYNYEGYQVSRIVNETSVNDNIDAKIFGAELELAWQPIGDLRFDGNLGYLHTDITGGSIVDTLNRTQGNPNLTVVKSIAQPGFGSNCAVQTSLVAAMLQDIDSNGANLSGNQLVDGTYQYAKANLPNAGWGIGLLCAADQSVGANLKGNELPNSPHLTASVGAQETWHVADSGWNATLRGDYYYQTSSYARVYNTVADQLKGWSNLNFSLALDGFDDHVKVLFYVKNALDKTAITDTYLTDDTSGLWTNAFVTDPRLYGVSLTVKLQ